MLATLRKILFGSYKKTEPRGIFISVFDEKGTITASNGVIETDKPLDQLVETLYLGMFQAVEKTWKIVTCDVVTDYIQETDMEKIITMSMQDYGLLLSTTDGSISGVILPNTEGIADVKNALTLLKKKYPGLNGNINVFFFKTERLVGVRE